ncbi:OmpA family protein [Candidatus Omnitrophota bacterium]
MAKKSILTKVLKYTLVIALLLSAADSFAYQYKDDRKAKQKKEIEELQERFDWWPTDAQPGPVKDEERGGYWWWPTRPGQARPWGNRGYVYVYKIIFDYKRDELPPPKDKEPRAALVLTKVIKNVKVYFDFDKAVLREDATNILAKAVKTLKRNPESSILITGNCDIRGSEKYNEKLGKERGEAVKQFMLESGVLPDRIKIVSRGKLDAISPITDLIGMQKDRNAQFMIAEVQEVMVPYSEKVAKADAEEVGEDELIVETEETIESEVKVSTREYTVQENDTLSGIAHKELGSAHRWEYLYELNKDRIKNPDKLRPGQKLIIPVE